MQIQQKRHLQENTAEDNAYDDEKEEEIDECHQNDDKQQHNNGNHDHGTNDNDANLGGEGYKSDAVVAIYSNADTTAELGSPFLKSAKDDSAAVTTATGTASHSNESYTSLLCLSSNGYDVENT